MIYELYEPFPLTLMYAVCFLGVARTEAKTIRQRGNAGLSEAFELLTISASHGLLLALFAPFIVSLYAVLTLMHWLFLREKTDPQSPPEFTRVYQVERGEPRG